MIRSLSRSRPSGRTRYAVSSLRASITAMGARFKRLRHKVGRLRYEFRYRFVPRYQYHLVRTGLKPGYYDQDYRLLHANFALLVDYVDEVHGIFGEDKAPEDYFDERVKDLRETPDPFAPDGLCAGQADSEDEAVKLYRWWKFERPANHERLDKWCQTLFGGQWESWVDEQGHHCCGIRTPPDTSMGTQHEYWDYERQLGVDDQRNLHRLIDIRRSLWI